MEARVNSNLPNSSADLPEIVEKMGISNESEIAIADH
jgi:hypothetical protein